MTIGITASNLGTQGPAALSQAILPTEHDGPRLNRAAQEAVTQKLLALLAPPSPSEADSASGPSGTPRLHAQAQLAQEAIRERMALQDPKVPAPAAVTN